MKGFLFMAGLVGLIDLLEHVSKLSVFVQLVNSLPWEKIEANKRKLAAPRAAHRQRHAYGGRLPQPAATRLRALARRAARH
mmetsp:Transcript_28187/g.70920  ORF Transcript_28187/g.70920 Transcript_28187/m.70920 type:complete len:81 (+) Transcript_28187:416-658(+)